MYTFREFSDPVEQRLVFASALEQRLHLTEGNVPSRSRMENLATGHRLSPHGLTLLTVSDGKTLVGWATCEHASSKFFHALRLKDPFRKNSTITRTHDWGYVPLGSFSVFVDPKHRGKGLAVKLLTEMERVRTAALHSNVTKHPYNLPLFEAEGLSHELVERHCVQSGVLEYRLTSPNLRSWNHFLTSDRLGELEFGEPTKKWKARRHSTAQTSAPTVKHA